MSIVRCIDVHWLLFVVNLYHSYNQKIRQHYYYPIHRHHSMNHKKIDLVDLFQYYQDLELTIEVCLLDVYEDLNIQLDREYFQVNQWIVRVISFLQVLYLDELAVRLNYV